MKNPRWKATRVRRVIGYNRIGKTVSRRPVELERALSCHGAIRSGASFACLPRLTLSFPVLDLKESIPDVIARKRE